MQPLLFVGKEGKSAQESVEPQRMAADARLKLVLRQKRGGKYGKLIQQEHIETNKISCSFYKHQQTIDTNEEYRSCPKCLQNLDCQKRPQLTRRDFWSPRARDKRRNVPGNISSIRPQCAACENLIKAALIRPDETLSHFSPHWEPTFKKVPLQMLYKPALRLHLPIFAGHCFKEFLLCFKPLLLSTLARSVFCLVQDGLGLFCGGPVAKNGFCHMAAGAAGRKK